MTSKIQMEQLDNPLGSFKMKIPVDDFPIDTPTAPDAGIIQKKLKQQSGLNLNQVVERSPFGNMGVDFGNILGNVGSKSLGGATSKELGQVIPELNQAPDVEIPTNIINEKGFTDLFSSVQKGSLKIDAEPTTPIEKIGVTSGQVGDFIYTRVTSAQELELELKTIQRKITNVNMGWTGSAADVRFKNAKAYNDGMIKAKQIQYQIMNISTDNISQRDRAAWMHYFINKNGTIERVMPLETFPNTKSYAANIDAIGGLVSAFADIGFPPAEIDLEFVEQQLKDGISIIVDAGHAVSTEEKTQQTYSKKSITDESWKSLDKVLSTIVKVFPYVEAYNHDDLLNDIALGPGFEVSDYLKRYGEDEDE